MPAAGVEVPPGERAKMFRSLTILLLCLFALSYCVYFPGRQGTMAFTLATGIGVGSLQSRVDTLEAKAVQGDAFSEAERAFVRDLYTCFAKGGRLTWVLREPAAMMEHYLAGSGEPLHIEPALFLRSGRVRDAMARVKKRIHADATAGRLEREYRTGTFYMNDPAHITTFVALHFGELVATPIVEGAQPAGIRWRAELPWQWPSYDWVYQRFGRHHEMTFPIPNAMSLLRGPRHSLWIDDGLGEHLVTLGLAKPFVVYAEWDEPASSPSSAPPAP